MLPDSPIALPQGTVVAKDFRIERLIAEGGMGAVYAAEQLSTGRKRALKLMLPELARDEGFRSRFELEAKVGSRVPSDHVVEVVAAGFDDALGRPFLAMELLEGQDLDAYMKAKGPQPPATVLAIFRPLCHALGLAHQAGIVHRDLKPENLFLAKARVVGLPFMLKVLDFGIAKVVAQVTTKTNLPIGTPLWMAPEQTNPGVPIGPTTDVWPLGLIAFYMLTGKQYWRSAAESDTNPQMWLREILLEPLPPASKRAAELGYPDPLPAGFDDWLGRVLLREPEERLSDATEAFAALEPVLAAADPGVPRPVRPSIEDAATVEPTAELGSAVDSGPAIELEPAVSSEPVAKAEPLSAKAAEPEESEESAPKPRRHRRRLLTVVVSVLAVVAIAVIAFAVVHVIRHVRAELDAARGYELLSRQGDRNAAAQAVKLFERSCRADLSDGCAGLGITLRRGRGRAKDLTQARMLLESACRDGSLKGCAELGLMLSLGEGGAKDEARAVALCQNACDGGEMSGCANLGFMYQHGQGGLTRSLKRAKELYRKACDGGDEPACKKLSKPGKP